jgi:hypothetical protein
MTGTSRPSRAIHFIFKSTSTSIAHSARAPNSQDRSTDRTAHGKNRTIIAASQENRELISS